MAVSTYRGFDLKTVGSNSDVWQVQIKNRVLQGSTAALKKSIDWFCDSAMIIDPKEFSSLSKVRQGHGKAVQETFFGYIIKNDTGEPNSWYCLFNGKLIKGGKLAIQKHIEGYLIAKKKAEQQKK
ncbi:DUF3319 domain-containing protein [Vibrio renipiscarius]|uniref:DUF3319 domain-containing protein n=1 Tax=Vibrio renipiscarius TaxID=1461322 RepID=UPI00355249F5